MSAIVLAILSFAKLETYITTTFGLLSLFLAVFQFLDLVPEKGYILKIFSTHFKLKEQAYIGSKSLRRLVFSNFFSGKFWKTRFDTDIYWKAVNYMSRYEVYTPKSPNVENDQFIEK